MKIPFYVWFNVVNLSCRKKIIDYNKMVIEFPFLSIFFSLHNKYIYKIIKY